MERGLTYVRTAALPSHHPWPEQGILRCRCPYSTKMEEKMQTSNSYAALEEMIQRGQITLSKLEHLLDDLQRQERITASEHEALLELAWTMRIPDNLAS